MCELERKFGKMCEASKCPEHWHLYEGVKARLASSYYPFIHDALPYYTNHTIDHVNRILEKMQALLEPHLPVARVPKERVLSVENLNLLLSAAVWHDIGNIYGERKEHAKNIHGVFDPVKDFLYDDHCAEWIEKIAKAHSGPNAIEQEIDRPVVPMHRTVLYPQLLAGLLRICDEMEEDQRRVEKRILDTIPPESQAYWKFCMANEFIMPSYEHRTWGSSKTETTLWIVTSAKLDKKEISASWTKDNDKVQAIEEYIKRIDKINKEREYCNRFLDQGQAIYFRKINGVKLSLSIYEEQKVIDNIDFVFDDDKGYKQFFEDSTTQAKLKKYR